MAGVIRWIDRAPRMSGPVRDHSFTLALVLMPLTAFAMVMGWDWLAESFQREDGEPSPEVQRLMAMDEEEMRRMRWPDTPETLEGSQPRVSSNSSVIVGAPEFALCASARDANCVADGNTLHYKGITIRIADIVVPDIKAARCDKEAELGRKSASRLVALLNEGPFSFHGAGKTYDKRGRRLIVVARNGRSLGDALMAEGLARAAEGPAKDWCSA